MAPGENIFQAYLGRIHPLFGDFWLLQLQQGGAQPGALSGRSWVLVWISSSERVSVLDMKFSLSLPVV